MQIQQKILVGASRKYDNFKPFSSFLSRLPPNQGYRDNQRIFMLSRGKSGKRDSLKNREYPGNFRLCIAIF